MLTDPIIIFFDGGSRGNPGPAAGAAFADFEGGHERVCYLESATNNEAEYRGLLMAIELANELQLNHVLFQGDSKLVVMQISGEWQAKHPKMQELKLEVLHKISSIAHWQIQWIRREFNAKADLIANKEMDRHLGVSAPTVFEAGPEISKIEALSLPIPAAQAIANLNSLGEKVGFDQLRRLKVGGMDSFSRMSLINLALELNKFDDLEKSFIERIKTHKISKELNDAAQTKLLVSALRWSARGLLGDLPIRKILVDLEISQNMRIKKSK
ncbi:MAG: ribonuclease HI family protein [Proteobacteria bacterium]|nr:ribonuclease HI family protein [Pseudomonadota bacterium]